MPDADLRERYTARGSILERLRDNLERETKEALARIRHIDRITFRVKDPDSFVRKTEKSVDPPYENPLSEIEDQVAGRVIVFFLAGIDTVLERLSGTFTAVEGRRRSPARDEEFGYESHHLICIIPPHAKPDGWAALEDPPQTFELQVRTIFMHAYSEPQHDLAYKGVKELPSEVRRELAWIAASAWGADRAYDRVVGWARENGALIEPRNERG